jgi:hypothetical protein
MKLAGSAMKCRSARYGQDSGKLLSICLCVILLLLAVGRSRSEASFTTTSASALPVTVVPVDVVPAAVVPIAGEQSTAGASDNESTAVSDSTQADSGTVDSPDAGGETADAFYTDVRPRPEWVKRGSYFDAESQSEILVVASRPRLRQREAEEELQEQLVQVVRQKVDELFVAGAGKAIGIDLAWVRENVVQPHPECDHHGVYHHLLNWRVPEDNREMLESDVRDAFQCFSQVKLDSDFRRWAERRWEDRLVLSRTLQTGLIALATLAFLTIAFGYLTAEQKTRGFYSRRLQSAGLACLAIAVVVLWWLATRFAWL